MLNPYRSPAGRYRCQTIVRRSIFTATLSPVVSPEEAHMFWDTIRHEFRDASHHGFACRTGTDLLYEKSSDDGEPAGTAGHPILSVMQKKKITNSVLVVSRWFGGIKLGTGGLIRAYSGAAAQCIEEAPVFLYIPHIRAELSFPYEFMGIFEKYAALHKLRVDDRAFTDRIYIKAEIPSVSCEESLRDLTDLSAGRIIIKKGEEFYIPVPQPKI
ncbi:MAG TPA: YigZ family protein [Veillonellaceae bacterium]|nr:YigZ family protein [Veillonellaceae bacterium]